MPLHARRRWDQLLEAVVRESAEEGGEAAPAPGVLLNQFRSLVMQRYIERVPPCTLPPPPQHVSYPDLDGLPAGVLCTCLMWPPLRASWLRR